MKIAIYTCNFGNYRNEFSFFYNNTFFDKNIDYFLFTDKIISKEENRKLNNWNICNISLLESDEIMNIMDTMDMNRLTSKYVKFVLPDKLENYDVIVWVDNKMISKPNIINNLTRNKIINLFQSYNTLVFNIKHPERKTMQEELALTIKLGVENTEPGKQFLQHIHNYVSKFDLPDTCLIIRKNHSKVNEAFEHCFALMQKYKLKRDQNIYNYALDEKEITPILLDIRTLEKKQFFTPLHISNADKVGGNECKGNVTMRICNAQRFNNSCVLHRSTVATSQEMPKVKFHFNSTIELPNKPSLSSNSDAFLAMRQMKKGVYRKMIKMTVTPMYI